MIQDQGDQIAALRTKASTIQTNLDSLRSRANLSSVFDSLEDVDSDLNALPGRLAQLRSRGYVFKNHLEGTAQALHSEWPATRMRVQMDAEEQRRLLSMQMDDLQSRFLQAQAMIDLDATQAGAALSAVEGAAQMLERSANTAISSLSGMYNGLRSRLNAIRADVQQAEKVLDLVDQASFKLYPQENAVDAVEAQWLSDQKGGPKGILFCTDHRLLFEQREDVATKRVLFVVTEKQRVQQLVLEVPIGAVDKVKESESGALLFRKDHLDLTFGPSAKVREAHFILKGDSAAWQKLINRINAGELEKERVATAAAATAAGEKPKQIPVQCPACGARMTQTLVRGMTSVKCQYCGSVIPL